MLPWPRHLIPCLSSLATLSGQIAPPKVSHPPSRPRVPPPLTSPPPCPPAMPEGNNHRWQRRRTCCRSLRSTLGTRRRKIHMPEWRWRGRRHECRWPRGCRHIGSRLPPPGPQRKAPVPTALVPASSAPPSSPLPRGRKHRTLPPGRIVALYSTNCTSPRGSTASPGLPRAGTLPPAEWGPLSCLEGRLRLSTLC